MTRSRSWLARVERRVRRSMVSVGGQEVLAILGMHRSGTSSLAGSLEQAGLFLGERDVAGKGKWNAKGNRESKVLMKLHEDVLRTNGGAWDRPPHQVTWSDDQRGTRDRFIASRATQRRWGFKDPRTLLLIDGWLEAIPDLRMVATIRHPMAVAHSLQRRADAGEPGDRTLDDWLRLWRIYNERLLELHEIHRFPIVDFDLPADRYRERLDDLVMELGLHAIPESGGFFESSLRSAEQDDAELPPEIAQLYSRLTGIAASGTRSAAGR